MPRSSSIEESKDARPKTDFSLLSVTPLALSVTISRAASAGLHRRGQSDETKEKQHMHASTANCIRKLDDY